MSDKERCEWTYRTDSGEYYDTECGEAFCCSEGTLEESFGRDKYKFCPFCGKSIDEARACCECDQRVEDGQECGHCCEAICDRCAKTRGAYTFCPPCLDLVMEKEEAIKEDRREEKKEAIHG